MKKTLSKVMLCLLSIPMGLAFVSCGSSEDANIVEACRVQESESDCMVIGNNILILSEDSAGYQCVWTGSACISQLL